MITKQTTMIAPVLSPKPRISKTEACQDVSRGAKHLGIGPRILIDPTLLDDYAEPDHRLGLNTTGVVLSAFSTHLKAGKAEVDQALAVCLVRREDGALVDVELAVRRFRSAGTECFTLKKAGERQTK